MWRSVANTIRGALCSTSEQALSSSRLWGDLLPQCASAVQLRTATKKAASGTRNNKGKGKSPKNLGIKMGDGQLIFPGQLIVRQRGYHLCRPGYNVVAGRDHTLHSKIVGFVKFHKEQVTDLRTRVPRMLTYASVVPVDGDWSPGYQEKQAEMIERRQFFKRHLLGGGGKIKEPALFFPMPDRRPPHIIKREQLVKAAAAAAPAGSAGPRLPAATAA